MSRLYTPKKMSTKLMEGAVAGLVGGLVVAVIMILADALLRPGNPWWYTPSLIGSLVTGSAEEAVRSLGSSFLIGTVIHFLLFALIGMGFTSYKELFQRLKIPVWVGGAVYGAFIWLMVFFVFLNVFKPAAVGMMNNVALFVACVLGGAAIGWWMTRPAPKAVTR